MQLVFFEDADEVDRRERHRPQQRPVPGLQQEFERSFTTIRDRLVRVVASLIGASDAEDVVQDAYLIARQRLGQLRDISALEAWLFRIAVNAAYSRKRRHRTEARAVPRIRAYQRAPASRDLALLELIHQLSPPERTLVVLHYGHGYRLAEIGQMLGLTEGAVKARLFRTRRILLRQILEASDA